MAKAKRGANGRFVKRGKRTSSRRREAPARKRATSRKRKAPARKRTTTRKRATSRKAPAKRRSKRRTQSGAAPLADAGRLALGVAAGFVGIKAANDRIPALAAPEHVNRRILTGLGVGAGAALLSLSVPRKHRGDVLAVSAGVLVDAGLRYAASRGVARTGTTSGPVRRLGAGGRPGGYLPSAMSKRALVGA